MPSGPEQNAEAAHRFSRPGSNDSLVLKCSRRWHWNSQNFWRTFGLSLSLSLSFPTHRWNRDVAWHDIYIYDMVDDFPRFPYVETLKCFEFKMPGLELPAEMCCKWKLRWTPFHWHIERTSDWNSGKHSSWIKKVWGLYKYQSINNPNEVINLDSILNIGFSQHSEKWEVRGLNLWNAHQIWAP